MYMFVELLFQVDQKTAMAEEGPMFPIFYE